MLMLTFQERQLCMLGLFYYQQKSGLLRSDLFISIDWNFTLIKENGFWPKKKTKIESSKKDAGILMGGYTEALILNWCDFEVW